MEITYLAEPILDEILLDWLHYQWKISNHPKYQHLFDEWIRNITPDQISGFRHNMESDYINHKL